MPTNSHHRRGTFRNLNAEDDRDTDLEQPLLAEGQQPQAEPQEEPNSEEPLPESLPSFSRLVGLGRPEFGLLTLAGLLMLFSQVSQLFIPLLVGRAYDDLVDPDSKNKMASIHQLMFWAVIIHLASAVCSGLRSTLMGIAGERIVARMRTTLYASILQQEIAFFDATQSGQLVSRLGSDTMVVKRAIASSWAEVVLGLLRLIATLALMFVISPKLAGLTVGSTVAVFLLCLPFGKMLGSLSKSYQETLGEAQNYPTEVIGAMRTVKSFNAEPKENDRYTQKIGIPSYCPSRSEQSTFRIGYDQSLVRALFGFLIFGGGFGAMYGTLWYGFCLVHNKELKLGDLSAFQAYILGIGGILAHMSSSISNLIEAKHASQRIFALLDREPKITNSSTPTNSAAATNDHNHNHNSSKGGSSNNIKISFQNVSFFYPTRPNAPVLQNFSLNIPKDKTTAIVGPSGAGKSTILSLLERFYDVQDGSILLDGVDLRNLDLQSLRKQLGYVQQEPTLFGMSIRDNLSYGLDDPVSDEDLLEACRTANAYDFVNRLPNGLEELVGERGVTLSGGQKQRLAIARAILLKPSVLLLDEATSALDAESEFLVQQAMEAASKGKTVLVVAHRLSTIQRADQIVVLDENHTLCDAGTHDELLHRCQTYQTLIARQSFGVVPTSAANLVPSPRKSSPRKTPLSSTKRQEERLKKAKKSEKPTTTNGSSTSSQTNSLQKVPPKSPAAKSPAAKSPVPSNTARRQKERLKKAKKSEKPPNGAADAQTTPKSPMRTTKSQDGKPESITIPNDKTNGSASTPASAAPFTPTTPSRDDLAYQERFRQWREKKKNESF